MDPKKEIEGVNEYLEAGVELPPEIVVEPEPKPEPVEVEEVKEVTSEAEPEEEPAEPLQPEPQAEPRKRSIYKEYKETKSDLKTEKQLREIAERKIIALEAQLENKAPAVVNDELEAFAEKIGADPAAIKQMKEIFLKDLPKNELPSEMTEQLAQFAEWQKENSEAVDKLAFENEFKTSLPTLTKMFPNATPEATESIKTKLNELAHTEAYSDKELDYIAFKNQDILNALISPKKRGLETKGRTDVVETTTFTFDPNADLSKLSPKQAEEWEKAYQKATSSEGLQTDSEGRKLII